MTLESENNKKLKDFFAEEYQSLKSYVNYRIQANVNRDAEDIIQDVALKLFSSADRYSPIQNVAGFVYRSIRNRIIDIMRSPKRTSAYDNNDIKESESIDTDPNFDEVLYSDELKARLHELVLNLKPDYRDIIIAYDFQGYSYKEISQDTGVSEGTLMSRRHRAIAMLHKQIENKHI
jgi:RNA polymerase sigma-70 factor (ECF subfamily)